jgi:hypothetical protein
VGVLKRGEDYTVADPGFQARGGVYLKKLRRAEGGAKICGVFRVKNHDFTPKNHIFSNFRGHPPSARPLYKFKQYKTHPKLKNADI